MFTSNGLYITTLAEDVNIGTEVATVKLAGNYTAHFQLDSNAGSMFAIDSSTGMTWFFF